MEGVSYEACCGVLEEWKEKYRSLEWVVVPNDVHDAVIIRRDKETDVSSAIGVFSPKLLFKRSTAR